MRQRFLQNFLGLMLRFLVNWCAVVFVAAASSADTNPRLLNKQWSARWIAVPNTSRSEYGVYHFRRVFELPAKPPSFVIHVTGDNRYQLYVNGERVVWGPARGDLSHWRYETIDIARSLKPGKNVLAATVWNFAQDAPEAQLTRQTGFLLQGDTDSERVVDSSALWKCMRDEAYRPLPVTKEEIPDYYVAGPGERLTAPLYPWGWERLDFDDSSWQPAEAGEHGMPRDAWDNQSRSPWELASNPRMLVPRSIPLMEERPARLASVRRSSGVTVPPPFPGQPAAFQISPHTRAKLLLDQSHLVTAYPELITSGGKGAAVSLRYAEALWIPGKHAKGNRNEVEGKEFRGNQDVFLPDGGHKRLFRPLWWRTYRYLELSIETMDEPLRLEDLRAVYTGYPFIRRARFEAGSSELEKILDVGWRTARLCAHETYMDCPYYEQLQYAGDTRVQALVSLYMTGDGRLMRNAVELLNDSRTSEGATYSRAPSRTPQYIPPFSLWWVGMVHDYWVYIDDPAFVRQMLPGVRAVLSFFGPRQKPDGSLGPVPWWNFVDWTKEWRGGVPPAEADGSSAPLDLQLVLAYGWAAEMEAALGSTALAAEYHRAETRLRATVRNLYWDSARQLFADTPRKAEFSQHTNALAILAEAVKGEEAGALMRRILEDASLVQCSIYFRHYLHSALNKAGEGDLYLDLLGPWRAMLDQGLTTWSEIADPTTRSDCHAWGASPNYELLRTVLGIDSSAPGFQRVSIRPFPGKLTHVSGTLPHPKGEVKVSLSRVNGKLAVEVSLPEGVTGEFIYRGAHRHLQSGKSKFVV